MWPSSQAAVALARLPWVELEGPKEECPVILFCSQRQTHSSHSSSHTQGGLGAGPATKELEAKLNKRKLNVVPQRGWNHFWGSSERKGSKLHPTLEIAVPRQIPRRTAGQSQTRPLSVRWQDREFFHVVPKLAQMEAFWVGPLQSVNSSGWGQGSRRSPISASCLTEAQATQSTMASSFLII